MTGWDGGGFGDALDPAEVIRDAETWLHWRATTLQRTGDAEHDDLVQEGRIAMWRSLGAFDVERATAAGTRAADAEDPEDAVREAARLWAMTAAKMRMRDVARRGTWLGKPESRGVLAMPRPASLDDLLWREGSGDDTPLARLLEAADLLDGVELAYHRGEIYRALAELPPAQREYVVLRFWAGYSEREIREVIGRDPGPLWRSQRGARTRLRAELGHLVGSCQ